MVFKSKSDYIFGAYSPCKWESSSSKNVEDNTLSSFIFSQTHDQVYPLKEDKKQYAIYCYSSYGPCFGGATDIYINGDFTNGYSILGSYYQFNQYKGGYDPYLFELRFLKYQFKLILRFQRNFFLLLKLNLRMSITQN